MEWLIGFTIKAALGVVIFLLHLIAVIICICLFRLLFYLVVGGIAFVVSKVLGLVRKRK